jgi:hypothetical protein
VGRLDAPVTGPHPNAVVEVRPLKAGKLAKEKLA